MRDVEKPLTISQLNKIGERLRKDLATEDDLRLLDEFRLSFQAAYDEVFAELSRMGLNPGGRPQKTTLSIIAKLNRERTRLSRMQDIAGCRVVVDNMIDQDRVIDDLKTRWPDALVYDRRIKPSHGYRAVHVVVTIKDRLVEIQVRTSFQHRWASAAEKLSDIFDPDIKYGGGPEPIQEVLIAASGACAKIEELECVYGKTLMMFEDIPIDKAKLSGLFTKIIQQNENYAHITKMLKERGVFTDYLGFIEQEMKALRDDVKVMLKKLSEPGTISS
jgi:putative GTP pyrophosphokinase